MMMVAVKQARVAVVLLLLEAAFAAEVARARPSFNDLLFGQYAIKKRSSSVSVAAVGSQDADYLSASTYGYDDYGIEEKEICLQEVARRACVAAGAPGASEIWT
jgi:hypothetical protein